jgi:adenosylhomocysteine nucleosidase
MTTEIMLPASQRLDANRRAPVIALTGLAFEARIAAGTGIEVISAYNQPQLEAALEQAIVRGCRGIISFGVAGGLAPSLRTGDWVVPSVIVTKNQRFPTHPEWSQRIEQAIPGARAGEMLGVDEPVSTRDAKQALYLKTGALAVDMESHLAAKVALQFGLAFAALRIIIDPADRTLPPAALLRPRASGQGDLAAILRSLAQQPGQLPAMARLAFDAWIASRALLRCRRQLGERFAFVDVGHHPFDVA